MKLNKMVKDSLRKLKDAYLMIYNLIGRKVEFFIRKIPPKVIKKISPFWTAVLLDVVGTVGSFYLVRLIGYIRSMIFFLFFREEGLTFFSIFQLVLPVIFFYYLLLWVTGVTSGFVQDILEERKEEEKGIS